MRLTPLNPGKQMEALTKAIDDQLPCTISKQVDNHWQVFKTQFSSVSNEFTPHIHIDTPSNVGFVPNEHVGIGFRIGHKKILFHTVVRDASDQLVITWPKETYAIQRKFYQRSIPHVGMRAHFRYGDMFFSGELLNISLGGMLISTDEEYPLQLERPVSCGMSSKTKSSSYIGQLSGIIKSVSSTSNNGMQVSIQFVGLDASNEGIDLIGQLIRRVRDFQRHS